MLDKFKSLFSKGSLPPHPASISSSHSLNSSSLPIPPQCPFSKKNAQEKSEASMKCPVTGKAGNQAEVDSDSE